MTNQPPTATELRSARHAQRTLGQGLARHLSDVTVEAVPDDLLRLLAEAERRRKASASKT